VGLGFSRGILRTLWRRLKWPLAAAAVLLCLLLAPVGYVELACRGEADPNARPYSPLLTDPASQRLEANTYLTYPEWHIVYAYDGLAEALKTGDEHAFDYASSVTSFWRSTCALMRVADAHGGADGATRGMIHTIGVSFTVEMGLKALYEETIGRATAWWRGPRKTPQDLAVARMAADYSAFLRQTPWYAYPFPREARALWAPPAGFSLRAWERRLGIGTEFMAKAAYAKVIEGAVAATEVAKLEIRSVIGGLDAAQLTAIPNVTVIGPRGAGVEINTPRYDLFTRILVAIATQGGTILEIAGNDDIMVTITVPAGSDARVAQGAIVLRMPRSGFSGERWIVDVPVRDLAAFLDAHPLGDPGLEHIFDY
jgi:hypothetical protein